MIGAELKRILDEQGVSAGELSKRAGVPVQTLYSIIRRDSMKVDFEVLLHICTALGVPLETFYPGSGPEMPNGEEWGVVRRWRRLDAHGRKLVGRVLDTELERLEGEEETGEPEESERVIRLYLTPAAAGFASPVVGEDYEDYTVPARSKADFAVRIEGDSMEPYIKDGSVALVKRGETIRDGDVGLFFADSGMVVKQYCQDYVGDVRLFSLNRKRADADVYIKSGSDMPLCCFGKVLLDAVPLPHSI